MASTQKKGGSSAQKKVKGLVEGVPRHLDGLKEAYAEWGGLALRMTPVEIEGPCRVAAFQATLRSSRLKGLPVEEFTTLLDSIDIHTKGFGALADGGVAMLNQTKSLLLTCAEGRIAKGAAETQARDLAQQVSAATKDLGDATAEVVLCKRALDTKTECCSRLLRGQVASNKKQRALRDENDAMRDVLKSKKKSISNAWNLLPGLRDAVTDAVGRARNRGTPRASTPLLGWERIVPEVSQPPTMEETAKEEVAAMWMSCCPDICAFCKMVLPATVDEVDTQQLWVRATLRMFHPDKVDVTADDYMRTLALEITKVATPFL